MYSILSELWSSRTTVGGYEAFLENLLEKQKAQQAEEEWK